MDLLELFFLSVGLSMDAFAVAVCKGLGMRRATLKNALVVGAYFGVFQAGMPLIGYFLGRQFAVYITAVDHWIAFGLLLFLGVRMIAQSRSKKEDACVACRGDAAALRFRVMVVLAVATSIDALAVGISLAFLKVDILAAVSFIGVVTFLLSMVGVKVGNAFGAKWEKRAELIGGVILICIGLNILLEHLGIIHF